VNGVTRGLALWSASSALFLAFFVFSKPALAANRNVPADYATIADAIAAASNGDTVVVANGTYTDPGDMNLDVTVPVTIASANGATSTTVDLTGGNYFAITKASVTIQGFTFENGSGSAVLIGESGATLAVAGCDFEANVNSVAGGPSAIDIVSGTLALSGSTFHGNTGASGTIEFFGTGGTVDTSVFDDNAGGAIFASNSTLTVTATTFSGNSQQSGNGGALALANGTFSLDRCTFSGNSSAGTGAGGAVYMGSGEVPTTVSITRSSFSGNSADQGGAIFLSVGDATCSASASDSVFVNNTAYDGAVVAMSASYDNSVGGATFFNTSFYGNRAQGTNAGAISGYAPSGAQTAVKLTNAILYGDATPHEISTASAPTSVTISHSDVAGPSTSPGTGNIDADPQYENPSSGDLHIALTSPCAYQGIWTGAPATDFDGTEWTDGISMGAFDPRQPTDAGLDASTGSAGDAATALVVDASNDASATEGSGDAEPGATPTDARAPTSDATASGAGASAREAGATEGGAAAESNDSGSGCSCRVAGPSDGVPGAALASLALAVATWRRRRRRSPDHAPR
jgi:MYXO-CTERM domain-containing protein